MLFSVKLTAHAALGMTQENVSRKAFQVIEDTSQQAVNEMRALIWQLKPVGLEQGLVNALKQYSKLLQLELVVKVDGLIKLPSQIEENVYRIVQEAMNNTKKHSETTQVRLDLVQDDNYLLVTIADFGKGFDKHKSNLYHSHGLNNMKQRTKQISGNLTIEGEPNKGTKIHISIPLESVERKVKMNQIILVDDHHIVRQGLELLLSTVDDIEVVKGFSDGKSFLKYLEAHELPDIVLLDLVMPNMNGIEITEIMKQKYPEVKILVLTSYVDDEHVISAIDKGADGYEMKDVEPETLIKTIKNVLSGEKVIHPQAQSDMESVSSKPHYTNKRSKRESEVLTEMAKGKTNKEIAETLFVSEKTVKTQVSHIFAKLQVSDRT